MEVEAILADKKKLQSLILDFLENDEDAENFLGLTTFIEQTIIPTNKQDVLDLLKLLFHISNNHHRCPHFFDKILQIINFSLPYINLFFTDFDIFNIFKQNRLLLILLIQNKIINPESQDIKKFFFYEVSPPKRYTFYPFFKPHMSDTEQNKIEAEISRKLGIDLASLKAKSQLGENDSYICKLIREDSIDDFVVYMNKHNYPINSTIEPSIYETNEYLQTRNPTLIEYASFFGSIQIFKYLQLNKATINHSIWDYAVHSQNAELIHIIEEVFDTGNIDNNNAGIFKVFGRCQRKDFFYIMNESIKCHHNAFARYFKDNYINDLYSDFSTSVTYYNYEFVPDDFNSFLHLPREYYQKNISTIPFYHIFLEATNITIPSSANMVSKSIFGGFKNIKNVFISSSVISLEPRAFSGCNSLTQVTFEFPSSLTTIGSDAFRSCSSLVTITIPSSVTSIGSDAFSCCSSLSQFIIPSSVTSIGSSAFAYCSSLEQIIIPSSVTSIGSSAFAHCSSLKLIEIPSSVTSFGSGIFDGIQSLRIVGNIQTICDSMFQICSLLKEIEIPPTVTRIGNYAFKECSQLTRIIFATPSSLTSIGQKVFGGCTSLKQITIPPLVTCIDMFTFYGCTSLEDIELPPSLTTIKNSAFSYCTSLKQIKIPSSVTTIESYAFNKCTSLVQTSIPPSVKNIGENIFNGCSFQKGGSFLQWESNSNNNSSETPWGSGKSDNRENNNSCNWGKSESSSFSFLKAKSNTSAADTNNSNTNNNFNFNFSFGASSGVNLGEQNNNNYFQWGLGCGTGTNNNSMKGFEGSFFGTKNASSDNLQWGPRISIASSNCPNQSTNNNESSFIKENKNSMQNKESSNATGTQQEESTNATGTQKERSTNATDTQNEESIDNNNLPHLEADRNSELGK